MLAVQVAEVELMGFFVSASFRTGTEGAVRKHPAVRRNIESGPIMAAHAERFGIQAALPLRRNACDAAHGDEEQGIDAAVSGVIMRHTVRNALHENIIGHKAVVDILRDPIVDGSGLFQVVGASHGNFFG